MVTSFFLGALGFYLLVRSADLFIDGAASIGNRLQVSDIVIGLLLVAFGTSMPEFAVNMIAALNGNVDIALGNVVGSNIANILLVLGIAGLITPLTVPRNTTYKEVPFALLAASALAILSLDHMFTDPQTPSIISRGDGLILLFFFGIFLYYIASIATRAPVDSPQVTEEHTEKSTGKIIGYLIGGLAGLVLGGMWIVDAAVNIATALGVSETMIGLTIVAIGTSLPELAASVAAARKHKADIVIGNIIGSNIFNTFWILGATALIAPIPIDAEHIIPLGVEFVATLAVFIGLIIGQRHVLPRTTGAILFLGYVLYLLHTVFG